MPPHLLFPKLFPVRPPTEEEAPDLPTPPPPEEQADMTQFMIFSPFVMPVDIGIEPLLLLLGIVKLAKTDEGLKVLKDLGIEYLKTVGRVVSEIAMSSTQNWLTALLNQKLVGRICKRLGLISAHEMATLESSYHWIFATVIVKEGITDTLSALGTFASGVAPLLGAGGS